MYSENDYKRYQLEEEDEDIINNYRSPFRRDLERVVHSHCFRRLAGKTQLFPKNESDFFRNRLTHSMEVAQTAKSIALRINHCYLQGKNVIDTDLVELAGLAHDIGHPPFGHQGEEVLAECMKNYGGFEGNAQTLRVLSKLEKKIQEGDLSKGGFDSNKNDRRGGLNLTYRALASILKYDSDISDQIHRDPNSRKVVYKGYYSVDKNLVNKIKQNVGGTNSFEKFRTVECQIMDIADDITYSTFDLEDAFKAGFISPLDMLIQNSLFYDIISKEINNLILHDDNITNKYKITPDDIKDVVSDLVKFMFELPKEFLGGVTKLNKKSLSKEEYLFLAQQYSTKYNKLITTNGFVRTNFSSQLVRNSIDKVYLEYDEKAPLFSKIKIDDSTFLRIEILKRIAFNTQILSPKLKAQEHRGKWIVRKIFESLRPLEYDRDLPPALLPDDFKVIYQQKPRDIEHQYRTICDYIACMTDDYAIEFYGRLTSKKPSTIFRPH